MHSVTLDRKVKDKWGVPVARVRVGYHRHDLTVGRYLGEKAGRVLRQMGARNIRWSVSGSPPQNLVAGGCRFPSRESRTAGAGKRMARPD
ncbi:MAG: hypothetical protein HYY36_00155, partial [Gammaproteobacteria bacterium]|nr:hypothetical protein [Gammaproteobacteria bacterium]